MGAPVLEKNNPPLRKYLRSKGIYFTLYRAYFGQTTTYNKLDHIFKYPEKATLRQYIIISQLSGERLDVLLRMAMEVTIKGSPYCTRMEYQNPRIINPVPLKRITKETRAAGKKGRVNRYMTEHGYAIRNIERLWVFGQSTQDLTVLDCVKIAMCTKTTLAKTINYIIFDKFTKKLQDSPLLCREDVLAPIPLVLPYSKLNIIAAHNKSKESIFYEFAYAQSKREEK